MKQITDNEARDLNQAYMRLADQALDNVAAGLYDAGLGDWSPICEAEEDEIREAINETAMHTWDIGALLAATIEGGYLDERDEDKLFDILARATKKMLEENDDYNHSQF